MRMDSDLEAGLMISGICLILTGLLFVRETDWKRRWIGFLLASAGAAQIGCLGSAWATTMTVCWVVFLIVLILVAFFEEPEKK